MGSHIFGVYWSYDIVLPQIFVEFFSFSDLEMSRPLLSSHKIHPSILSQKLVDTRFFCVLNIVLCTTNRMMVITTITEHSCRVYARSYWAKNLHSIIWSAKIVSHVLLGVILHYKRYYMKIYGN